MTLEKGANVSSAQKSLRNVPSRKNIKIIYVKKVKDFQGRFNVLVNE